MVNKITETDAATGQTYLKLPIANTGMVENALKLLSGLFGGMGKNKIIFSSKKFNVMHELTKHEKKIARILIDKGTDTEFRIALEQVDKVITQWKKGAMDNRTAYHKMYKKVNERDSRISNRYDGLTGSRYLLTVASIYIDGQIDESDLKDFSEQTRAILNQWLQYSKEK